MTFIIGFKNGTIYTTDPKKYYPEKFKIEKVAAADFHNPEYYRIGGMIKKDFITLEDLWGFIETFWPVEIVAGPDKIMYIL